MKCSVDDLARLITEDLTTYSEEVEAAVEDTIVQVTDESLRAIRESQPIQHMTQYKKGFRAQDVYKARGKHKGYFKLVISNVNYRITHLLEKGHAKRNGGRVQEYPHWISGEKIAETLPDRVKDAIDTAGR